MDKVVGEVFCVLVKIIFAITIILFIIIIILKIFLKLERLIFGIYNLNFYCYIYLAFNFIKYLTLSNFTSKETQRLLPVGIKRFAI